MNETVLGRSRRTWVRAMSAFALVVALPAFAQAPLKLTVGEEAISDLSTFNYTGAAVSVTPSNGYLLCANTPWPGSPSATTVTLQPTNPGFEFGAVNVSGNPISLNDVRSFRYGVGSVASVEVNKTAAPGTLGCFVTNSAGNRVNWYNGLFVEGFDTPPVANCTSTSSDSCAAVRVASLVPDTDFNQVVYTYYIDYHLPAGVANYTLRDGYNSTRFGAVTSWCPTLNQSSTSCTGTPNSGRTVDAAIAGSGAGPVNGRIRVVRRSIPGVTKADLEATAGPLVLAALFPEAPARSLERVLGDNVSAGTAVISDQAPVFNQLPGEFQANKTTGMANTSFTISDDTIETGGMLLKASASVRFGTLGSFPAIVDCGSTTPQPAAPTRTCNVSFVPPTGFVNFATFSRPNVTADVTIIATDSLNQSSTTVPIKLVVTSTSNSTPVYTATPTPVNAISTLICSVSSSPLDSACSGATNFLTGVAPGPIDAQDELVTQVASILTAAGPRGGNIACVAENGVDPVTFFNGQIGSTGPFISPGAKAGNFNLTYGLNAASEGHSVLCNVDIVDDGRPAPLPASFQLRIQVVP